MTEQRTQKSSPFLESFELLQILFHLQTLDGAIEGCFGANDVDVAFASVSEALFNALFGAGGAVEVNLSAVSALGERMVTWLSLTSTKPPPMKM